MGPDTQESVIASGQDHAACEPRSSSVDSPCPVNDRIAVNNPIGCVRFSIPPGVWLVSRTVIQLETRVLKRLRVQCLAAAAGDARR